jgi:DNA-binding FadR family transcriptional regulator
VEEFDDIIATSEDEIILQLLRFINAQHLQDGAKLPSIRELAELWEFNPSQIRSGLLKASALGLVEMKPRAGCFVRHFDFSSVVSLFALVFEATLAQNKPMLLDLYNLKTTIETGIFRTATKIRTEEDVYKLKLILDEMEHAPDRLHKIKCDEKFHLELARITRNPLFEIVLSAIQAMLRKERFLNDFYENHFQEFMTDHRRVFQAIRDQNVQKAVEMAEKHSEKRKRRLMRI